MFLLLSQSTSEFWGVDASADTAEGLTWNEWRAGFKGQGEACGAGNTVTNVTQKLCNKSVETENIFMHSLFVLRHSHHKPAVFSAQYFKNHYIRSRFYWKLW